MPSSLRESSSSNAAPDQNRTARPVVLTRAPFVDKTTSPDDTTSSPMPRETQEPGGADLNRTSPKTVGPALWASVPALLLLGLGAAMRDTQLPRPLAGGDFEATGKRGGDSLLVSDQSAVIPQSQTLVVPTKASTPPVVWQARLLSARGVTGRAPIDGQITRVYVHEGQNVEVGDRVLRIASSRQVMTEGPEEPEDMPAPLRTNRRAERAQVRAAQAKNALQDKMARAQEQLIAAQQRVVQAKARIARTTEIVRKLQAGITDESSTRSSDQTDDATVTDSTESRPSKDSAALQAATQKHSYALRETQDAERRASRAESRAASAQKRAEDREEAARGLTQKARDLRAQRTRELRQQKSDEENQPAADEPLARSEASASASDGTTNETAPKATPRPASRPTRKVSVSQEEVEAAQSRARSAASQASSANDKAQTLATEAARARAAANTSSGRASRLMSQLQLFSDDAAPPKRTVRRRSKPRLRSVKQANDLPSISQAARLVQAATEESAAAQSEARRLKAQFDSYSQQAQETRQNLDASSSALEASQQSSQQRTLNRTLDRTLVANLSVVRAPSSGTVLWVAPVADDISSGEPIIRMAGRGALHARFADRSGLWRSLKPDMLLPARVSDAEDSSEVPLSMPKPNSSSTRLPLAPGQKATSETAATSPTPASNAASAGISAMARVESVMPPERAGEPAIVRVAVSSTALQSPGAASVQTRRKRLRSGMTVSCLFPRPVQSGISLPRTAILSGDAAPALLISALSSPEAQQSVPRNGQDNGVASGSNNSAAPGVVSGAKGETALNGVNAAVGEKGAKTSAVPASSANASRSAPTQNAPTQNAATQNAATNAGWVAVLTPLDADQNVHRIEWRRVVLGADQSTANQSAAKQIVDGLRPGERVALQPSLLWTYSQSYGADATIRLSARL